MRELIRETVLGHLFWTLFQALAPMIWFYPLNELEISGYEAFALALFSPLLIGIPKLGDFLCNRWSTAVLRLISVASLASFQAPSTLQRLIILCLGCSSVMLVFSASIFSSSSKQRALSIWGLVLGLFAFLAGRIWFTTFVPAWWTSGSNSVVIAVSAVAVIDKIVSGDDVGIRKPTKSDSSWRWIPMGFGFGSLLYVTQALFGEVSVICRWVVRGYPATGPMPYPWGAAVLVALWFGVILSSCSHVTRSLVWWLAGSVAFLLLYLCPTWSGFAGGLVFAVYTMSIWPEFVYRLSLCPPAKTASLAVLVWLIEMLFSVWTVAYNFVPGGTFTREKTSWLIVSVAVTFAAALLFAPEDKDKKENSSNETVLRGSGLLILFLLVASGLGGYCHRYPNQTVSHQPKSRNVLTAAIWTYHFGYDNVGWPSLERSAEMLRETEADVITLLESDASKPYLGNNDLGMWLGEKLGMYVDFGPSTKDHTWGNLILSKYPFVKSVHHLLPSPHGELAPAITATVNFTGHLVDLVVTHMGNDRDVIDRDLQAKFLSNELKNAENPVIFLGYVTSAPFSRDYVQLTNGGNVKDIDETDRDRWCEYIMYRGLTRLGYARISHGGLSDTEIQVGRFRIPDDSDDVKGNERIVTNTKEVDTSIRFSTRFGGFSDGHNWVEKHRYHMSTPKYFLPRNQG